MNTPGLYVLPFGSQVLVLTAAEFEAGLKRGRVLTGSTAVPPGVNGNGTEKLLSAQEIAQATPGIPAGWYLESAPGLVPHVRLGKYVRFRLGEVVEHGALTPPADAGGKWSRDGRGRSR